jgi:hypothetical protein
MRRGTLVKIQRRRNSLWIALAAALALFIQSLLGSYALTVGPVQFDIFGNAICADGGAKSSQGHHPDGGHLPDCCILGCGAAQLLANTPDDAGNLFPPREFAAIAIRPLPATPALDYPKQQPGNPRAPPFPA